MGRRGPNAAFTFLAFPAASYKFGELIIAHELIEGGGGEAGA